MDIFIKFFLLQSNKMTERFHIEGKVTGLSRIPSQVRFDGKQEVDTFVTKLDLRCPFDSKGRITQVIYPDSTSIRPGDYISAEGAEVQLDGMNYRGLAEKVRVLDRGLFRNKRWIKHDYECSSYTVKSWHW